MDNCFDNRHCLIVEGHPVVVYGLKLIIETHFSEWKISTASSVREAVAHLCAANSVQIDLVLLDVELINESGLDLLAYIRAREDGHSLRSLIISAIDDATTIKECKSFGANGFISKHAELKAIVHALSIILSGKSYFPSTSSNAKDEIFQTPNLIRVTTRQQDVINLVMSGCSNKQIAANLNISYGTVKNYMFDLMRIFSVRSRLELALKIQELNSGTFIGNCNELLDNVSYKQLGKLNAQEKYPTQYNKPHRR